MKHIHVSVSSTYYMPVCLSGESGEVCTDSYSTVVYYHANKPLWNETIKVRVNFEEFLKCHVRFLVWHKSRKKENVDLYAAAFLNLADEVNNETAINDAEHKLVVFSLRRLKEKGRLKGCDLTSLAKDYLKLQHIKSNFRKHHNEESGLSAR